MIIEIRSEARRKEEGRGRKVEKRERKEEGRDKKEKRRGDERSVWRGEESKRKEE